MTLERGWFDGNLGTPFPIGNLAFVGQTTRRISSLVPGLTEPTVAPTPDGNIDLEWDSESEEWGVVITFDFNDQSIECVAVEFATKNMQEQSIPFKGNSLRPDEVDQIATFIQKHIMQTRGLDVPQGEPKAK